MPLQEVPRSGGQSLVRTHVHTDGPIPGPHSLLTLTAVAHAAGGEAIGTFTTNVRELPGATLHPTALRLWRGRAQDWLTSRRRSLPPAVATTAFARWVEQLPGPSVLVADPSGPDYLFLFWYLQRFTDRWPFAGTDAGAHPRADPEALCPLTGCRSLARAS